MPFQSSNPLPETSLSETAPPNDEHSQLIRVVRHGFALLLTLTVILGGIGLYQLNSVNTSMSVVSVNNAKITLALAMRDAIRLRALAINKMLATADYFKRDSELLKFYDYAQSYRDARDQLVAMDLDRRESDIIEKLTQQAKITQPVLRDIAELLMENQLPADFNRRFVQATQMQETLFELLDQSIALQREYANHAVAAAQTKYEYTVVSLMMVLALLLSIGVVVAQIVVRYVSGKNTLLALKNAQLQAARAKADEATQAKSRFLANMSHEIRTPLTTILGFSQSLADDELSAAERQRAALAIRNSGKHLYDMVNDVLDISKIEAGKLDVETVTVSPLEVVKDSLCIIESKAADRGLQIQLEYELPLPQTIQTDPLRLKQILLNLCANAVKFTETGGITIELGFDANTRHMVFWVRDTGIGMTGEQVDKVFLPFQQADKSTSRSYGGTGLGLSISKQLAQRLGGDLQCRSEVDKGTTFTLRIPEGEPEPTQWISEPPKHYDMKSPESRINDIPSLHGRVLLAEDMPDIRALILMYLQRAGLDVVAVANGQEAVQEVSCRRFDLVLMDMQMPVMDGLTAIRKIRSQGINTPIVALTANATREDKHRCLSSGADNFLTKPVEMEQFYLLLAQYLSPDAVTATGGEEASTVSSQTEADDFERQMQQLVDSFLQGLPQAVNEITTYYRGKHWQELLSSSHRLKGAGGAFGYPELSEISKDIMEKAKQHNHQALQELIDRLNQRCRQITRKAG